MCCGHKLVILKPQSKLKPTSARALPRTPLAQSLQQSRRPLTGGEGGRCPLLKTDPCCRPFGIGLRPLLQTAPPANACLTLANATSALSLCMVKIYSSDGFMISSALKTFARPVATLTHWDNLQGTEPTQ